MAKAKKTPKKPAAAARPRVTVLGYSAMAVLRWMGAHGWDVAAATKAIEALGEGGKLKASSIATGLSDGRSGKWGAPAPVTVANARRLRRTAK